MIMQLLFHIMLLSWPVIALAQAPELTKSKCQSRCGNVTIPFPFGIGADCYIDDWFAIECISGKPFFGKIYLEVLEISLQNSTIRVNHPVFSSCSDLKSVDGSATILYDNLKESPFVFSGHNRFIGLGCNNLAYMSSAESVIGGCFSNCYCDAGTGENDCYGMKCCQTRIPSSLKIFNATLSTVSLMRRNGAIENDCIYAFLVDLEWFRTKLKSPQDAQKMSHVPVVLDWGIFNYSFSLFAENKPIGYKSTSYCEVSANIMNGSSSVASRHSVLQCSCNRGYEGNPYFLQGCTDIDECNAYSNICGEKFCKNYIGGFGCFSRESKINTNMVILGIGTGLACLFLLLGAWRLCFIIKRRMNRKEKLFRRNGGLLLQQRLGTSDGNVDRCKLFNSKELKKATDSFNMNRILGQGGQGTVYKGMLADGRIVAIKKSKAVDEGKLEEFINEVAILAQINHRNVVKLLGCCLETEVPLLVYEFIPNGTLFQYLHNKNEKLCLTWDLRLQIAIETAGALSYLHSAASLPIYHRDIKSTNILLDDKYTPKIADFGTSRSIAIDQTHVTTKVQGTFGYLDPEYFHSSQLTDKSDVYSFGVVLVELLTGQKPISSTRSEEDRNLAAYFIFSMKQNCLSDILDNHVIETGNRQEIIATANVAKRCLDQVGKKRPTMKEVFVELERIQASQSDGDVYKPNFEEVESLETEVFESLDIVSTSTSSIFTFVEPHLTNASL